MTLPAPSTAVWNHVKHLRSSCSMPDEYVRVRQMISGRSWEKLFAAVADYDVDISGDVRQRIMRGRFVSVIETRADGTPLPKKVRPPTWKTLPSLCAKYDLPLTQVTDAVALRKEAKKAVDHILKFTLYKICVADETELGVRARAYEAIKCVEFDGVPELYAAIAAANPALTRRLSIVFAASQDGAGENPDVALTPEQQHDIRNARSAPLPDGLFSVRDKMGLDWDCLVNKMIAADVDVSPETRRLILESSFEEATLANTRESQRHVRVPRWSCLQSYCAAYGLTASADARGDALVAQAKAAIDDTLKFTLYKVCVADGTAPDVRDDAMEAIKFVRRDGRCELFEQAAAFNERASARRAALTLQSMRVGAAPAACPDDTPAKRRRLTGA